MERYILTVLHEVETLYIDKLEEYLEEDHLIHELSTEIKRDDDVLVLIKRAELFINDNTDYKLVTRM